MRWTSTGRSRYPACMKVTHVPVQTLELRVRELEQLFNSLDPSPFLTKDLAHSAEAYIESWAMPIARGSRLHLTIHVEQLVSKEEATALMAEAIHNHYDFKSDLVRAQLRQLLRRGRTSLAIGATFVATCLLAAETFTNPAQGAAGSIARESLTIIGWVAMWRPVQIFLYDWWPVVGRIHVYDNLKVAGVDVVGAAPSEDSADKIG